MTNTAISGQPRPASAPALRAYRILTDIGAPLINGYLRRRMIRGKEDKARFAERTGIAGQARPAGSLVWLHAASVGEAISALSLIRNIAAERPEISLLVTTGTVTSAEVLAGRLPPGVIHQYAPVDRTIWTRRFLNHWQPDLALWVESEFWPNILSEIGHRQIPLILVNGRISNRSYRSWQHWPRVIAALLAKFDLCLARTQTDADRLREFGAARVEAPGNLKFAAEPLPASDAALAALQSALSGRPYWLAASTHPGEDEQVATAHRRLAAKYPGIVTIIVPRHPARGPMIRDMMVEDGLAVALRSAGDAPPAGGVYIADGMGELGLFYRLCNIAFVGGSLVPHGGQNMLEAIRLDCAVICGPHTSNFGDIVNRLKDEQALSVVTDGGELADIVSSLIGNESMCEQHIRKGKAVAEAENNVLENVLAALAPFLEQLDPADIDARRLRPAHAGT